jgi:NAD+ diphosphatase
MYKPFKFCPHCGNSLVLGLFDGQHRLICSVSCGYVYWKNRIPVVAVLIEMNGKYVLVKRGKDQGVGKGTIVGGMLEAGDDAIDADCFATDALPEMASNTHTEVLLAA